MSAVSDYGVRRNRMADEQLAQRGINDDGVLAAMRSVPRHLFVPEDLAAEAYADTPLPIGHGQTISQPYMVALMTSLLKVDVRSRVLEVGSGSGYQTAAVLAEMAGEVYALELIAALAERARAALTRLGYRNVHTAIGDGTRGWPEEAPFDAVLVAAAAPAVPPALLDQLADRGRLAIPLGEPHGEQVLTVFHRFGDRFAQRRETRCRFVPLLSGPFAESEPRGGEDAPGASTVALREAALDYEKGVAVRAGTGARQREGPRRVLPRHRRLRGPAPGPEGLGQERERRHGCCICRASPPWSRPCSTGAGWDPRRHA